MGWVKRRLMTFILVLSMTLPLTVSTSVEVSASQDYLSITLADIIIAWYNASGVAIGDSEIVNAIYSLYGNITLADLVDHDCIAAADFVYPPGNPENRAYTKEVIGYGNLTVPMVDVMVGHLQAYLGEIPLSNKARESLLAMFGWEGNLYNEVMFGMLGAVIGSVANIGKIAYNLAVETISEVPDYVKSTFWGKRLSDIYKHFTDTTYFQDLLEEEYIEPGSGTGPVWDFTFNSGLPAERGGFVNSGGNYAYWCCQMPENVFAVSWKEPGKSHRTLHVCNLNNGSVGTLYGSSSVSNHVIGYARTYGTMSGPNSLVDRYENIDGYGNVAGYAVIVPDGYDADKAMQYCIENNPWGGGATVTGITKYINNAVGNILSDNYINLSPNIGSDEYMYIFDRPTYIETLNQITNNTDNGDYSQNSVVINNYNTEYVDPPVIVPDRPTSAPAPTGQPVQPTVSPRPTQVPEEVSNIIYEGGISEEITKKFPFCIPWDIKAMIDRLWTPDRRAPYIHWDATFGSWGKLGEVDIDLREFDNAAAIFRSTTLLLWIVGLVIITKHLIG